MSGLSALLDVATSGLNATQDGLQTDSNNISNVNTPGFAREQVALSDAFAGQGSKMGRGVSDQGAQRAYSQFLQTQMWSSTTHASGAQTLNNNLQGLSGFYPLGSGATGLNTQMTHFFSALQTLSTNPSNMPDRQAVLGQAHSMASSVRSLANHLDTQRSSAGTAVAQTVTHINQQLDAIAKIDHKMLSNPNNPALADKKNHLITELSGNIGVHVLKPDSAHTIIMTRGGQNLLQGHNAHHLKADIKGAYGDGQPQVIYSATGSALRTQTLTGRLGSQVQFARQVESQRNQLGMIARGLADVVNRQQSLGVDLNNQAGPAMFAVNGPSVYANASNQGSETVKAHLTSDQAKPHNSILSYTNSGWEVTNTQTGKSKILGSGTSFTFDGVHATVSGGAPKIGDAFKITPAANSAASLRVVMHSSSNVAAAAPYVATPGSLQPNGSIQNTNQGNVSMSAATAQSSAPSGAITVPASSFGDKLSVNFAASGQVNVVDQSTGATVASGTYSSGGTNFSIRYPSPPAPSGYVTTFHASGTAVPGDAYTLSAGDPGNGVNANQMSKLLDSKGTLAAGSIFDGYKAAAASLGNAISQSNTSLSAAKGVYRQAQKSLQAVSGVNLNQEAAQVTQLSQAFKANSQVISVANKLFTSLLSAAR